MNLDDQEIIRLYFNRDEKALEETALKYGLRLRILSEQITGSLQDAQECENDTYLTAWNRIPPHEPVTYFFAFLAKIVRNISINCWKQKKAKKRSAHLVELTKEMEECLPSPSDVECKIEDAEFGKILNTFLREQKEEARTIFLRRYWFADPIAEISRRYALSESKVKSQLFRTRKNLRAYLEKEGYDL
ncbi:RNA polymerase sigma factor [Anaerolentibacter hominis]|uniref:RNA polymerase sigma factor n=1 Tax=Anaerolentibacter hominis TaxID=3079009 RepID=UPI0031B89242